MILRRVVFVLVIIFANVLNYSNCIEMENKTEEIINTEIEIAQEESEIKSIEQTEFHPQDQPRKRRRPGRKRKHHRPLHHGVEEENRNIDIDDTILFSKKPIDVYNRKLNQEDRQKQKQEKDIHTFTIQEDLEIERPIMRQIIRKFDMTQKFAIDRGHSLDNRKEPLTAHSSSFELKNILKQAGGLSLSEILQQRNLSLNDLLIGKPIALAAIAQPTTQEPYRNPTIKTQFDPEEFRKRIPIFNTQSIMKKEINESSEANYNIELEDTNTTDQTELEQKHLKHILPTIPTMKGELLSIRSIDKTRPIKEVISAIRPDLTNSNTKTEEMYSFGKLNFPSHQNKQVITDSSINRNKYKTQTTFQDKRLKMQSNTTPFKIADKYMGTTISSNTIINEMIKFSSTQPSVILTTTPREIRLSLRPNLKFPNRLKLKEEIMKYDSTKLADEENSNTNKNPIIANNSSSSLEHTKQFDIAPIEQIFQFQNPDKIESDFSPYIFKNTQRFLNDYKTDATNKTLALFVDVTSVRTVDDKTDLLELMEDRRRGTRLANVLAQRNMTLDELVEHRKRGSSQLHLTEIFNKPKENFINEKKKKLSIINKLPSLLNIGNIKNVKLDEIKTDSQGSSYFTSIISIKPTDEIFKESLHPHKTKPQIQYSKWDSSLEENIISKITSATKQKNEKSILTEIENIEGSEISHRSNSNNIMDMEVFGRNIKHNNSVTIKNAIIASLCIAFLSILIFVIIFLVCRCRQKKINKINYNNENFNSGHLPILKKDLTRKSINRNNICQFSHCNKLNTMDPNSPEIQKYLYNIRGDGRFQ